MLVTASHLGGGRRMLSDKLRLTMVVLLLLTAGLLVSGCCMSPEEAGRAAREGSIEFCQGFCATAPLLVVVIGLPVFASWKSHRRQ